MNPVPHPRLRLLLGLVAWLLGDPDTIGQGALLPPGPPAPTFKTLDQIEPRTPISSAPFVISTSGSYYLTGNLTVNTGDAITISAGNVTLDLRGFTIASTDPDPLGTGTGVLLQNTANVTILNGHIKGDVTYARGGFYTGEGFFHGIAYSGKPPPNVRASQLTVSGCRSAGIHLGFDATTVESCTVQTTGGFGIVANSVFRSTASLCGDTAIGATIASGCYGQSNSAGGAGHGISAVVASECHGTSTSGKGIYANSANNCYGYSFAGRGIDAEVAANCYGFNVGDVDVGEAGVWAKRCAMNCYGFSERGTGVEVEFGIALGCYGAAGNNGEAGVYAQTAIGSKGTCDAPGAGLVGVLAFGSTGLCTAPSNGRGLDLNMANFCLGGGAMPDVVNYTFNMLYKGRYQP